MKTSTLLFLALCLLPALCIPAAGVAQADTTGTDTTVTDATAIPVAPIRITVLRTPLVLTETPFAVTVAEPAARGPGLTLADALGSVPGLQVDNRYNFSQGDRIAVRGLGARAQFGVRGVKVLVDGIPATLPDGQTSLSHLDPRAVERAEVIRGPASSLWGNAAGGVIQLQTRPVPSNGPTASFSTLTGAHGLTRYGAAGGWGDSNVGVGAAASRLLYDGFRAHAAADKRFGSARFRWAGDRDALTVVAHGVAYEAENPGSLSAELLAEDRTQAFGFNVAQGTREAAEQVQLGVTWRHGFGGGTGRSSTRGPTSVPQSSGPLLELTAWALTRDLDNPIPPVVIDLARRAAGVRGSVRGELGAAGRRVTWTAGVDAEGQWDDRRNFDNDGGRRGALVLDQAERVASVAPFAELRVPVAGPIKAMAGLRYDRHRFQADDRLVGPGDPDDSGERVMAQLSPSVGMTAELGRASVFANASSSFETPTTTELVNRPEGGAGFNPGLEPQRARSLEAGIRLRPGPGIRVHGAVYRTVIRNALIPFEVPSSPGRTFFRNAGSALHRGAELDAWVGLSGGFSGRLGYAWTDARFEDFVTADGDRSGNRVPGVAPHRVTATVVWTAGGARVELGGRWVDAIPADDANTAVAPSYTVVDVRAATPALPLPGEPTLLVGVDNALDAEYVASVVANAFGARYFEPGPGRAAYLGLEVSLGR